MAETLAASDTSVPGGSAAAPTNWTASAMATASGSTDLDPSAVPSAPAPGRYTTKPRSCVVCRSRKVRCDKRLPCYNCRRANIACIVASDDQPPRWARRLERLTAKPQQEADPATDQVMDRLRNLEKLVKELGEQLAQGEASGAGPSAGRDGPAWPVDEDGQHHRPKAPAAVTAAGIQPKFGRLVLQDGGRSQYVGSGFWSRVSDELDALKQDTLGLPDVESDMSDDDNHFPANKTAFTREAHRKPSERNGLLFGHNLAPHAPDLCEFRPLPSQIPFLVSVFAENINFPLQIVHLPTLHNTVSRMRAANTPGMTPADEALMFSVYYAAITSMDEEEVAASFGTSKAELNYKFRLGLEYALAKADFVRLPDVTLVQAFVIFLCLARRHDSPRYVWMMTGLAIRMGHAIGLHRDGSHLAHLSPYEAEIRRRVWWSLCFVDIRASEDQGTEFTIGNGSFDTKMPLNINDADLHPDKTDAPVERQYDTDMSFALGSFRTCQVTRQIIAARTADGGPDVEKQTRLLDAFRDDVERSGFSRHVRDSQTTAYWVGITVTHLVLSKLALFIHLPALFSSPSDRFSDETRNKLLVAAIEVAEFNHALNAEPASRPWRWIIQTYTHWHAIVYLLIETSRRPWSPVVERAWVALHSKWLIPAQPKTDRSLRVWIPLRKLMARARQHRESELQRLRGDAAAIEQSRAQDEHFTVPTSAGPFKQGSTEAFFVRHWCALVQPPAPPGGGDRSAGCTSNASPASPASGPHMVWPESGPESEPGPAADQPNTAQPGEDSSSARSAQVLHDTGSMLPPDWLAGDLTGLDFTPGMWDQTDPAPENLGDTDVDLDMGDCVDWNAWLDSVPSLN
ncbi:fungal specific transcription factor domain-containing protein [Colletotrichum tofieldiae]|uniref:Fungal specific transcription factor domain-containing protein n=1 Tax=Colletotrichum tofieldiae TaxID=708197 RepID=A0A166YA89_9PEZI|nr:fungal specific transcription factor domain-containing protein [Colletotrichum tofieldiae]